MDANVMDAVTLVMLAVGLAMDAFAVSITDGLCYENFHRKEALITSGAFGLFQGIMPLIGYFCGRMFSDAISSIDHWIALILLGVIGLNMIKEAWQESRESECENCGNKTLTLPTILMQAVATSIDALAVGISFAVIHVNIFTACLLICGITFGLSLIGAAMGKRFGSMVKEKARVLGGVFLILIGLRIFVEHMFF